MWISPPLRLRRKQFSSAYVGAVGGHFASPTIVSSHLPSWLGPSFPVRMIDINAPFHPIAGELNEYQPDCLSSYGSVLPRLAESQLNGSLNIQPTMVRSAAEPVTEQGRALVAQAFGIGVQNIYGSTEHLIMGLAAPPERAMVLREDSLYFEFAADHTLVTNMGNTTQPLIRYRMDDVLIPRPNADPDSAFTHVEKVPGPVEHTPVFVNELGQEDFISPRFLVDMAVRDVRRYQLQLTGTQSFTMNVEAVADLDAGRTHAMIHGVHQWLDALLLRKRMSNVVYTVDLLEEIPLDPLSHKFKLVVPVDGHAKT